MRGSKRRKRQLRKRRKRWFHDPYLKASFALVSLLVLLSLAAVVSWHLEDSASQTPSSVAATHDPVTAHRDAEQAAYPGVIEKETTLYENRQELPEENAQSYEGHAPVSGVLIAEEEQEEEKPSDGEETDEDSLNENEETQEEAPADTVRTGRIVFVGDSRTIDLFADSNEEVHGAVHDGVIVYARHGNGYSYLEQVVSSLSLTANDTLVTWMGANDDGHFANYGTLYGNLLAGGVGLIVCTVGPTADGKLQYWDIPEYTNERMQTFNRDLVAWASANGVPVIDLYSYISGSVSIDPADGIHYMPRPDPVMWSYILGNI